MLPLVVAAAGGDAKRGHLKKKIDLVADQTKRVAHSELGALDGRGNIRATSFAIVGRPAAIDAADAEHDRTGDGVLPQSMRPTLSTTVRVTLCMVNSPATATSLLSSKAIRDTP